MAESLAMMPWFPRDFLAATRGWSVTEKGVYRELLDAQWEMGALPSDLDELRRLIGATEQEWLIGWKRCSSKFTQVDGGVRNERLEEHRAKSLELQERRRRGARSTNAKRWQTESQSESVTESLSDRSPSRSTVASSPSPSKEINPIGQSDFDRFWFAYPKKVKRKTTAEIWSRKRLDSKTGELLADIQRRLDSDRRWREGFIPDPTTYLNQERWGDELEIVKRPRVEGL